MNACFYAMAYSDNYREMWWDLQLSCKYFHPEIPFEIFIKSAIDRMFPNEFKKGSCLPFMAEYLSFKYDTLIHIDADSIVVAPLTDILEEDYEVASVRNNNDFGNAGMCKPGFTRIIPELNKEIGLQEYLNAGFFVIKNKQVIKEWILQNDKYFDIGKLGEQDTMNDIFHSGKYKLNILDSKDKSCYYGVANTWGDKSHYESWKDIILHNNKLFLYGKQIKVLHLASGSSEDKKFDLDNMFKQEVSEWIKNIIKR